MSNGRFHLGKECILRVRVVTPVDPSPTAPSPVGNVLIVAVNDKGEPESFPMGCGFGVAIEVPEQWLTEARPSI